MNVYCMYEVWKCERKSQTKEKRKKGEKKEVAMKSCGIVCSPLAAALESNTSYVRYHHNLYNNNRCVRRS